MKLEQAAQQALEALESYSKSDYIKKQHPKRRANGEKAITVLREALSEQAEQEPVCIDWDTKTDEPIMGYAAPVRTKDLTDDEIAAVTGYRKSGATWPVVEEVARAVIAADREKNK